MIYPNNRKGVNWILMKDEVMLSIGMISIALGILIERFVHLNTQASPFQILSKGSLLGCARNSPQQDLDLKL